MSSRARRARDSSAVRALELEHGPVHLGDLDDGARGVRGVGDAHAIALATAPMAARARRRVGRGVEV